MTDKLPPNLLALFAPRPPLRWVEAPDYAPEKRKTAQIGGVAAFLPELQKYKETDSYQPTESWLEAYDRKKLEKKAAIEDLAKNVQDHRMLRTYDRSWQSEGIGQLTNPTDKPSDDPNVRGDPYKTLIVARLSYDADERDLEREFGRFGPIERVCRPMAFIYQGVAWN